MLIGRDDIIERIREPRSDLPVVTELKGELGSGRTSILGVLQDEFGSPKRLFDLERYDPGHGGQVGSQVSVGAAQASYTRWVDLLTDIARSVLPPEDLAEIQRSAREARGSYVLAGRTISLAASLQELRRPFGPQDHVQAWSDAAAKVAATFRTCWSHRKDTGPLLLDNVDRVLDQELGRWLLDLLDALTEDSRRHAPCVAVVLTRAAVGRDILFQDSEGGTAPRAQVEVHLLRNLQEPEVGVFVRKFRDGQSVGTQDAKRLKEITAGHPATLRLVCELLYGAGGPDPKEVKELLDELPAKGRQQAALLVERLLERSEQPDLLHAVQAAAVPRRFNAMLLGDLLKAGYDYEDEEGTRKLFDALRYGRSARLPFVEGLNEDGTVLRLHEYVRQSFLTRLQSTTEQRLKKLSKGAADHFSGLLEQNHEDSRGVVREYGHWYLYESPDWQADVREWLYHSGNLTAPAARRSFLLDATRLFLDAFFWWGNYVHFDFCDKLVADLGQLIRQHERPPGSSDEAAGSLSARDWRELVRLRQAFLDILESYPTRSVKTQGANWQAVRDALTTVEDVCGLANISGPSERQQHVRALLEIFFAHTWRYASWDNAGHFPDLADKAYERADRALATLPDDAWAQAWVKFERAELTLARLRWSRSTTKPDTAGEDAKVDVAPVMALWGEAAAMVQPVPVAPGDAGVEDEPEVDDGAADEPDHELMSNLHRLQGEVLSLRGEPLPAAESYGRAVLHAYLFHVVGGPPDDYTLQFYVDVRARVLEFLLRLWGEGRESEALEAATRLWPVPGGSHLGPELPDAEAVGRLLARAAQGDAQPLAEALWPPGPEISDLGDEEAEYAKNVKALRKELNYDAEYLHDLHQPA